MNSAYKISTLRGQPAPDAGIDWEFQPSLQHRVVRVDAAPRSAPMWAETMPAPLGGVGEAPPFREALEGLSMREMHEPEIFRVFFGDAQLPATRP